MEEFKKGQNIYYLGNEDKPKAYVKWSVSDYREYIIIENVYVDPTLRNQNIAHDLVDRVVEFAREEDLKVTSTCSYASELFSNHEEYQDVVLDI